MADTSEFGAMPYAAGSVHGFRHFKLRVDGALTAMVWRDSPWYPGTNEARCHATFPKSVAELPSFDLPPKEWLEQHKEYEAIKQNWRDTHSLTECEHGFYAYFDGSRDVYAHGYPSITGIIEGYGEVLVGTQGFRAMKAHIVALSMEPFDPAYIHNPATVERLRALYRVPVFESTAVMRAEFPCPNTYLEETV